MPIVPLIRDRRLAIGTGSHWWTGDGAGDHARDFGPPIFDFCLYLKPADGHALKAGRNGTDYGREAFPGDGRRGMSSAEREPSETDANSTCVDAA